MTTSVVDTTTGRVALSRRQLSVLCTYATAPARPDQQHDDLEAMGAVTDGEVVPLLRPVVDVLTAVRARGALRRWFGATLPVVELLVGERGVVVLPNGVDPDVPQEVQWHPRVTATPRLLATLLDLPAEDAPPVFDRSPGSWRGLVELAKRADTGIGLADLRWADNMWRDLETVMVVAWHRQGGIAEVTFDDQGTLVCTPRHPLEVWTGLAKLAGKARRATRRPVRHTSSNGRRHTASDFA